MKIISKIANEWRTCRPPLPNTYNNDSTIGKETEDNYNSLKSAIKTQPWEQVSDMVLIYAPLFRRGPPE